MGREATGMVRDRRKPDKHLTGTEEEKQVLLAENS